MQSRQVSNFKINKMTKAQYSGIVPSQDEVYITTDEADAVLSVNGVLPNAQGNVTLNIPSAVTESTVAGWGFTKNEGTVTSVNGVSPTNGNVAITIPTVNNGMLTITQDGNTLGTFSANQSRNGTIDIPSGGTSRNIGEIVSSAIPLTDAELHILDGALISGSGSYSTFVDYIADLYDSGDYTAIFDTEANWQSAVTTYGVCSKFVYDSVNNTVRLPKYGNQALTKVSNISTASTVPVVGNGKTLGLFDGTTNLGLQVGGTGASSYYLTAGSSLANTSAGSAITSYSSNRASLGVSQTATNSGLVANTSSLLNITNYPLDCYYYIVVATSTKTQIQVDIDEIATDLNGKADVDLSNLTTTASSNFDGQWVRSGATIASGATLPTTDDLTYSLSTYLPDDNYNYEVIFICNLTTGTVSGNQSYISLQTDIQTYAINVCRTQTRAASSVIAGGNAILPVGTGREVTVYHYSSNTGTFSLYARGYRRIGTNS